ncbi:MAG: hypothetical protein JO061_08330 [Acidobacteriaceae bacterium]|nr:hypothetical protein [Acidobacteriaceae bacterium]
MKPVRFTKVADAEVQARANWYDQRAPNLGTKFLRRVLEAVEKIAQNPLGYERKIGHVRRCMVPRFQDALWFVVEPDESIVIACLHGRRSPTLVKERAAGVIPLPRPPEPS